MSVERARLAVTPLVSLADIAEIELFILKRMQEYTPGDHAGVFKGAGFNFVGSRDWEPGDRLSSIDWAQSSFSNFSPMVIREFEQDSTGTVVAVADASLSTRCGAGGVSIAMPIGRAIAAVGLSAVFFQDMFGLITFDEGFREFSVVQPRIGKPHVIHCLDRYEQGATTDASTTRGGVAAAIVAQLRKPSLVPVISDFLFADAPAFIRELSALNAVHDVFLMMTDARFAYQLPAVSAGWLQIFDVETGRTRTVSRRECQRLAGRVDQWQQEMIRLARDEDLDIVRTGLDRWEMETILTGFVAERRLRKV